MASQADYQQFSISIDDLEWSRHWLGSRRSDSLNIWVASDEETRPKVWMRAIESKATTSTEPIEPTPSRAPFDEGLGQVLATLAALAQILAPNGRYPLVEDLRFASFFEQLASVVLADLHPIEANDRSALTVVKTLNELSARSLDHRDLVLDGMVVCTQYRTAAEKRAVRVAAGDESEGGPWSVYLVRCGTAEVDQVLGARGAESLFVEALDDYVQSEGDGQPVDVDGEIEIEGLGAKEVGTGVTRDAEAGAVERARDEAPAAEGPVVSDVEGAGDPVAQLGQDLYLACRQRSIPVDEPEPGDLTVGPTLVSVSMPLQAGASIRPIESAVDDLAREVGVPAVEVENDPDRPYHVRFLLARRDRSYPPLPGGSPLVDAEAQHYHGLFLGRDLTGNDFLSYLSSWPHMIVAGTTGSGKTTFIQSLLRQFGERDQESVSLIVVDGKGEYDYVGLLEERYFHPQYPDVQLGHDEILEVLEFVREAEIPRRQALMAEIARASGGRPTPPRSVFVESVVADGSITPFPPLVVVVDEFAEIMQSSAARAREFERRIQQIAQIGRSSLVHLVLSTQRPDANVIKGAIKANLDGRIALRLPTHHDSMTVLGGKGAERLLGRGDLIFQSAAHARVRLQGYRPLHEE